MMPELLWKNKLVCAALEDQYVKIEVYKPNGKKCLPVKSSKKHLFYVNESGETNYWYHLLLVTETMR